MKVVSQLLILSCLLLSSCGIFGKYGSLSVSPGGSRFVMYHNQLSQEEISQLNKGKEIFVQFEESLQDHIEVGTLRILPTAKNDVYNFIEIGVWKIEGKFQSKSGYTYYKRERFLIALEILFQINF